MNILNKFTKSCSVCVCACVCVWCVCVCVFACACVCDVRDVCNVELDERVIRVPETLMMTSETARASQLSTSYRSPTLSATHFMLHKVHLYSVLSIQLVQCIGNLANIHRYLKRYMYIPENKALLIVTHMYMYMYSTVMYM